MEVCAGYKPPNFVFQLTDLKCMVVVVKEDCSQFIHQEQYFIGFIKVDLYNPSKDRHFTFNA